MLALRILNNRQEAEDVVQEVFMKMWSMQDRLDDYTDPVALATVMTRNSCIDILRRWKHQDPADHNESPTFQIQKESPHEIFVENETNQILNRIIENLPQTYREAVRMREIQGLDYEEIANLTGQNVNTLRVTISRARQMIREQYLNYSDERGKVKRTIE